MTVNQFTEKAQTVEKLINEAKARGVHIGLVLLDRAFFTIDVITALLMLGVHFIIPAVKKDKVKEAMLNYDEEEPAERFTLGDEGEKRQFQPLHLPATKRIAAQKEETRRL